MILKNIPKEIGATFYNGGWIKTVRGIDERHKDGYSITGEFVPSGLAPLEPGLYLVCDIQGSRKNQSKHYTLLELSPNEAINEIVKVTGSDWAIQLWKPVIDWYQAQTPSDKKALWEEKEALLKRLKEIAILLSE